MTYVARNSSEEVSDMSAERVCCHSRQAVSILICISCLILTGCTVQSEQHRSEPNSDASARQQERLRSIPGMMVDLRLEGPRQAVHYPSQALRLTVGMKNHGPEFMAPSTQQCFEVVVNERWYGWEHGADPFVPDEARYCRLARGDSGSVEIALTGTGYPNAGRWHEEEASRTPLHLPMPLQFSAGREYTIRLAMPAKKGTQERRPVTRVVSSPIRVRIADGEDKFEEFLDAVESGDIQSVVERLQKHPYFAQARGLWKIPLNTAIIKGHFDIAGLLLDRGVNPNMLDAVTGYTALHHGASAGNMEMVETLLAEGADPRIRNFVKMTPFGLAIAKKDYELAMRIMPADAGSQLWAHIATGDLDAVRESLADQPELAGSHLEGGATPLHLAVQRREIDIAKLMLSAGADVNATDCKGWTPLMSAAIRNRLDCVELLLEHGAATDIKSHHFDMTALDYAKQADHTEMIALLNPVTQ